VRFAQLLGYSGFAELRESLRDIALTFPTFLEQLGHLSDLSLSSPADLVRLVLRYEQENLAGTSRSLDPAALYDAAHAIANARTVTLVGSGVGRSVVHLLRGHLSRLKASVQAPGETIDAVIALANVGPGDVVLGVSFWRFARSTSEWLQLAKRRGAETIAIVDSPLYPAADSIDHLLLVRSRNPGHGPSTVAAAAVANMLISAVILTDFQRFFDAIQHVDSAYTDSHVYLE
jgi:DNA-binding MurR/RpiR family transcriptional regulator